MSNLEKLELAKQHPVAFKVGLAIGVLIPLVTLAAKLVAESSPELRLFWLLAFAGATFSILSLGTFGLGCFGRNRFGWIKTISFCALIEASWLLLPIHLPPSTAVHWITLVVSCLCFIVAIVTNAVEVASTMAKLLEKAQMEQKLKEQMSKLASLDLDSMGITEQDVLLVPRYKELDEFLERVYVERRVPRLKRLDSKFVLENPADSSSLVLYPR
jgi:hypothetical protein